MPIKVKTKLTLKEMPDNISKRFAGDLKDDIRDDIVSEILQGNSPVKGKTFKKYSKSYAKIKGWEKPVDMNKTGKMLKSLKVRQNKKGQLKIYFTDEKAAFHNEGKGNMPERRLLPKGKETFKGNIMRMIMFTLKKAVKKEVDEQN